MILLIRDEARFGLVGFCLVLQVFLFLDLETPNSPTVFVSGKAKAHKHKQFCPVTAWVRGRVSRPVGQESNVYVLCAELKEHEHVRPRPLSSTHNKRPFLHPENTTFSSNWRLSCTV